jgi:hypothetical protein
VIPNPNDNHFVPGIYKVDVHGSAPNPDNSLVHIMVELFVEVSP